MKLYKEIKKIVCYYCKNKGMCADDIQCNEIESLVSLFEKNRKSRVKRR